MADKRPQNNRGVQAQIAANRAARERAKADADRARAEAVREEAAARAEAARAETERVKAAADAERARASLERQREEARLESERAAREKLRREEEAARAGRERLYQTLAPLGAVGAGVGLGVLKAHNIEKKHAKYVAMVRPELTALGNQAKVLMRRGANLSATSRTRLGAIVATADKIGLTKARGPLGVLAAGMFLAEGVAARVGAQYLPTPEAKEAGSFIGMGLTAAAGGVLATRALQRASPKAVPAVASLSVINQARAIAGVAPAPVRATQGVVARVTNSARTAAGVKAGVLGAIGQRPLAAARRVAIRGGALGAAAAAGAVIANSDVGRRAVTYVQGFWRQNANGTASYVGPHTRRVG